MSINTAIKYSKLGVRARRMLTLVLVEGYTETGYLEVGSVSAEESEFGIPEASFKIVPLAAYAAGEMSIGDENEDDIPLTDNDRLAMAHALSEAKILAEAEPLLMQAATSE